MEQQKEIPNYSDVKPEVENAFPDAEKVEIAGILNKELIVWDFKAFPSTMAEGHEFVVCLADMEGRKVSFNCGEIVLKQLQEVKDKLPVRTSITRQKGKRYYTMV